MGRAAVLVPVAGSPARSGQRPRARRLALLLEPEESSDRVDSRSSSRPYAERSPASVEMLASGPQRALLHPQRRVTEGRSSLCSSRGRRRLPRRVDVEVGHDLDERDARAVVVHERRVGLVDPPAGAPVRRLARVLLLIRQRSSITCRASVDLDVQVHVDAHRQVVLAYLKFFGMWGEVVLPVEQRVYTMRHSSAGAIRTTYSIARSFGTARAGMTEAHGADVRSRRPNREAARPLSHVESRHGTQADDGLVLGHDAVSLPERCWRR